MGNTECLAMSSLIHQRLEKLSVIQGDCECSSLSAILIACCQGHCIIAEYLSARQLPYSTKFSRRIIFAVFADWSWTAKIKLANFFNTSSAQRLSLDNCTATQTLNTHSISSLAHDRRVRVESS